MGFMFTEISGIIELFQAYGCDCSMALDSFRHGSSDGGVYSFLFFGVSFLYTVFFSSLALNFLLVFF